jgi:predicted 3-demethylubiquinone-9 3-methyltransferase (glyoxalase superfamily)
MQHLFKDETSPEYQRVMEAMLRMKKLDIAALQKAYDG